MPKIRSWRSEGHRRLATAHELPWAQALCHCELTRARSLPLEGITVDDPTKLGAVVEGAFAPSVAAPS